MRYGLLLGSLLLWSQLAGAEGIRPELQAQVLRETGKRYLHIGRLDKAIDFLSRSVELTPEDPETLHRLGTAYYQSRDFPQACTYWGKACEVNASWCRGRVFMEARELCSR